MSVTRCSVASIYCQKYHTGPRPPGGSNAQHKDRPCSAAGLVLMNSAGKVEPGFQPPDSTSGVPSVKSTGPPRLLVEAVSRGLFFYLERNVPKTLVGFLALNGS